MTRCLLIEDSDAMRAVARRILEDLNIKVTEETNVEAAVAECAGEAPPDLVLLDWDLPDLGGPHFIRALRKEGEFRTTVVLCALENNPEQFKIARAAGVAAEILKPLDRQIVA
ncbi:MAG: response regulator, partial [Pseudomonadota bacterium]